MKDYGEPDILQVLKIGKNLIDAGIPDCHLCIRINREHKLEGGVSNSTIPGTLAGIQSTYLCRRPYSCLRSIPESY